MEPTVWMSYLCLRLDLMLAQMNLVHTLLSCFLKIYLNINLHFMPMSTNVLSDFLIKILHVILSFPTFHAPSNSILWSADYELLHYATFSILTVLSSIPCSQLQTQYLLPLCRETRIPVTQNSENYRSI